MLTIQDLAIYDDNFIHSFEILIDKINEQEERINKLENDQKVHGMFGL